MTALLSALADDPDTFALVVFGGGVLAVSLLTMLWLTLLPGSERQLARRIARIQSPAAARAVEAAAPSGGTVRRQTRDSSIASLDRLTKRILPDGNLLRLRLERSGLKVRLGDYLLGSLALGALTFALLWLLASLPPIANLSIAVLIRVGVPHLVISHLIKRRVKRFTGLLPEALDLIVRGIRSGLPATEAMNTIGSEIADPVGAEFRQVTDQVRIGINLDEAMWSAARRLQIAEFNFLVISLAIQQETGGNLAEILEKLSDMVRRREQMRLKIKAMSSEARASAMIIGALPFIMCAIITFVNPGYMETLFTDPRGWVMIGMGFTSLSIGLMVMAKMVRFEMSALEPLLPAGITPEALLVGLAALAAFLVVMAVWVTLIERNPMERRARMLAERRDQLRGQVFRSETRRRGRQESLSLMRQVVDTLKLMQSKQTDRLQDRLAQAGLRSRDAIVVFLFFKVAAPLLFAAAAFILIYVLKIWDLSQQLKMVVVLGALVAGFFAPELFVSNLSEKRKQALQKALPDGLDLLVICAESGLALDSGLERVAREIGSACPELGEELSLTSIELGFLPDRRQALHNLNRRTNLPSIRGVVNTLVQTEKYGTPLSQSLRVLANEFRDSRMLRAEEKAARLPATLTVPMIVFILPTLFIVLLGPAIISIMDNLG